MIPFLNKRRIITCALLLVSNLSFADRAGVLALDMRNVDHLPKNFRTTSQPIPEEGQLNMHGLRSLHVVGSGQFSLLGLKNALSNIPSKQIIVIDLRQEPHGFLNSNAVSWYGQENAINANKRPLDVENEQFFLLDGLLDLETVKVQQIAGGKPISNSKPVEFLVHHVSNESELVKTQGLRYARIYVQDHHPPSVKEVDRFVELIREVPPETWVYFHCRAGRGRTSTFMLMYDIMRNAKYVDLKALLKRQAVMGGKDLLQLPSKESSKYKAAVERIRFIKTFYRYVKENKEGYDLKWSAWLKQPKKPKLPAKPAEAKQKQVG